MQAGSLPGGGGAETGPGRGGQIPAPQTGSPFPPWREEWARVQQAWPEWRGSEEAWGTVARCPVTCWCIATRPRTRHKTTTIYSAVGELVSAHKASVGPAQRATSGWTAGLLGQPSLSSWGLAAGSPHHGGIRTASFPRGGFKDACHQRARGGHRPLRPGLGSRPCHLCRTLLAKAATSSPGLGGRGRQGVYCTCPGRVCGVENTVPGVPRKCIWSQWATGPSRRQPGSLLCPGRAHSASRPWVEATLCLKPFPSLAGLAQCLNSNR